MSKILIFGDFTTAGRGENAVQKGTAFSLDILRAIREADYSILNLEAPVGEDLGGEIQKIGPNLKVSTKCIEYLKACGINCVTLANNHFFDYGEQGVQKTVDALCANQINYVGGGLTRERIRQRLDVAVDDVKVSVLNYCEAEFSVRKGNEIGSNPLSPIHAFYDIKEAKKCSDIIMVIVHGGHEGYQLPSPRMQELYRYMIDCGANVVINHHQHCYSGYEHYNGGSIYYGLGNFFFDSYKNKSKLWTEGYFLSVVVEEKAIVGIDLCPYVQCKDAEASVRLMNATERAEFFNSLDKLNGIISEEKRLQQAFEAFCMSKKRNYETVMMPYSNRVLRALAKRHMLPSFVSKNRKMWLYDYVCCESHRDVLISAIENE